MLSLFMFMIVHGVLLTVMAVQDWKTTTVAGELCLVSGLVSGFALYWLRASVPAIILIAILYLVLFSPMEIPCFGDADIVPFAMLLSVFSTEACPLCWLPTFPLCLLSVLYPYAKIYSKAQGRDWHFGSMQYIPALPAFATAWWLTLICMVVLYRMGVY